MRARDQPGRSREGRAEERRGHEQHHDCGHREARRDLDRLAFRRAHRPHPREGLGVRQPRAKQHDDRQGARARAGQQDAQQPPGIASARAEAGKEKAAEREAREVGGEHHRERVAPGAQELDEELGPDDLIAEGHPAGRGVEGEGDARIAKRARCRRHRRHGGDRGADPETPIEDESRRRDREAEGSREEARALDAEGGHEQKRRRERANDRAGGVGSVEDAGGGRYGVGVWMQRPQQGR